MCWRRLTVPLARSLLHRTFNIGRRSQALTFQITNPNPHTYDRVASQPKRCAHSNHGGQFSRNVLRTGRERGLIQDVCPPEKDQEIVKYLAKTKSRCVYAGFDPTADSLHVGNLLVLQALLHFRMAGHKVIVLLGGATAKIGDPSGRSTERPLLEDEAILQNCKGIEENVRRVFANHAETYKKDRKDSSDDLVVLNNLEWYRDQGVLDYLARHGRHFRVGDMFRTRSVKSRLETDEGLSFTEFAYQTFQAVDWLKLLDEHECTMQVGGGDQMGNMRMGKELAHRVRHGSEIYGFTVPLVTTDKGVKIGKSAGGGSIWLSGHKTSPFDLYQYFVRVADKDVERMLKLFTFMPLNEIDDLVRKHSLKREKLHAQKRLAEQVTRLVHGEAAVREAQAATRVLYEGDLQALGELSLEQVRSVFSSNATFVRLLFEAGMTMLDLSMKVGCFRTEKDAARVISAGGFYVNQMRVSNTEEIVSPEMHFLPNDSMLLRVGKKNYFIVEWML